MRESNFHLFRESFAVDSEKKIDGEDHSSSSYSGSSGFFVVDVDVVLVDTFLRTSGTGLLVGFLETTRASGIAPAAISESSFTGATFFGVFS